VSDIYIYFADLPTSSLIKNLHNNYDIDTFVKDSYDRYWKKENQCCKYFYISIILYILIVHLLVILLV